MIAIIDYGLGNIKAFANIYKRLGVAVRVAQKPGELAEADRIILPGVGAFDWAMSRLDASGLRTCLDEMVLARKIPVLGVCVGMQIMGRCSEEGRLPGLAWIGGDVKRFGNVPDERGERLPLPHMGWNDVRPRDGACLFGDMESDAQFYFLHSYFFRPDNADHVLARTSYAGDFASAIRRENIYGVQFHPEKSHQWGIRLLKNFAEL